MRTQLRSAFRDLKETRGLIKEAQHDLKVRDVAIEKLRRELKDTEGKYEDLNIEGTRLQERLRELERANQTLERDGTKATHVNSDLRRDLRKLQAKQRDFEVERSDLARQLAANRRELEHLKFQLASIPRGSEAVWGFLRSEEARIKRDRLILSGGDRMRADAEWTAHGNVERAFLAAYPQYRQPPPVKIRQKTTLRFVALGGSGEIGRSCYLLELGNHRILVDCGVKPSATEDLHPAIDRLEHIDALILTHAHSDHIGWVPALIRRFGEIDIYCSEGTAALLPIMLEDCRKNYVRRLATRNKLAERIRNAEVVEEEYADEDMHAVPRLAIKCDFDEEEPLPFGDASVRFFRAGHILGAASVLVEDKSGRRIFLSGDFSSFQQLTIDAARWPDDLTDIDLLVLESTYGNRIHPPLAESRRELLRFLRETIEVRQGSVILASFGLGRAQELLKLIGTAKQDGELDASIPVHVDGMIRRINPIYSKHARFDFPPEAFSEVSGEVERQEIARRAQGIPSIIVTTSGMLTGGPVVEYARRLLPDARNRIVLTGFQDEGAPSRALVDLTDSGRAARLVQVPDESGEPIQFEAAMPAKQVALSAHADQVGLLEYAARLRPRHIALVHGQPDAQAVLRSRLLEVHPRAEISCGPQELPVP